MIRPTITFAKRNTTFLYIVLIGLLPLGTSAQSEFKGLEHLFTPPKHYIGQFTSTPPQIDGNISDEAWGAAQWSESFTDIEGNLKPAPAFNTRMKMLWDSTYLYVAAQLEDPHVWATLSNHDQVVYYDNDFEIFIDPDNDTHQYFEIEVNALNTIFDLFLPKPYRNGSAPLLSWDTPGLRKGVSIQGTLNNPTDKDKGWSVEMAIPFKALSHRIPREGQFWRINFSRVQWDTEIVDGKYVKKKDSQGKNLPEHNWVWSPQGVINMHFPERWGYLYFTRAGSDGSIAHRIPKEDDYLWLVYYRQKEFFSKNKKYAATLADLAIKSETELEGGSFTIDLEATPSQFRASIPVASGRISINDEGLVRRGR